MKTLKAILVAAIVPFFFACGSSESLTGDYSTFEGQQVFNLPVGAVVADDVVREDRYFFHIEDAGDTLHVTFENFRVDFFDLDLVGELWHGSISRKVSAGACDFVNVTQVTVTNDWPRHLLIVDTFISLDKQCAGEPLTTGVSFRIGKK